MENSELKRTPLYECHIKAGGKMVSFAGWEMPVQYSGLIAEHMNVRTKAGLFDVSHMGEIEVTGPEAEAALDYMTCNAVRKLTDGKAHYTAIPNEKGGLVDDVIIYRFSADNFMVCVNAANADKDFEWLKSKNKFNAEVVNRSAEFAQIAVQGPKGVKIVEKLTGRSLGEDVEPFHFTEVEVLGAKITAARTGYTGEDGFELFVPAEKGADLWQALLEVGSPEGLMPAGLGARDTLRLEACLPLYGHELSDDITAIESGLGWIVKPKSKGEFIGGEILAEQKKNGSPKSLIGFMVDDPGIAREGSMVHSSDGDDIGWVTSGTKTPFVNRSLGMAIVDSKYREIDTPLKIKVRSRMLAAHVVKRPFYKREQ